MTDLEQRAKRFATERHAEIKQLRKYTGEAYINHPASVVKIVRSAPHTKEMIAAAWLHDTVEDTSATLDEIESNFGIEVCQMVEMLTDISVPEDGNRASRKAIDREHTAKSTTGAMTIKLADLIDNSASILEHDPRFAKVYIEEKRQLLDVLKAGDSNLWQRANDIVSNAL